MTHLILLVASAVIVAAAASSMQDPPPSKAQIDLGRKVYAGNPGGAMCVVCHGPAAKGIPGVGPDLTDATWIHGDGSQAFLQRIITEGVLAPKLTATMMPPNGGGRLNRQQVAAVAAYLRTINSVLSPPGGERLQR
jgi:mono/diheme cytochrome c family protein